MKRLISMLLTLACLTALSGCGQAGESAPSTVPDTAAPATESTTVPETVPPTTQGQVILPAGQTVTVDGTVLKDTLELNGYDYIKTAEFLSSLDMGEYSGSEAEGYTLLLDGMEVIFRPDLSAVIRDGTVVILEADLMVWQGLMYLPVEPICNLLNISVVQDPERSTLYCTSCAGQWSIPEGYHVPVLMYHGVSDETWGSAELFVSPSDLEEQLEYLVENGYDPIFFEDLRYVDQYDKPVILTFDDGYADNYTNLYPLLQEYGVKATIFVVTDTLDLNPRCFTWAQAREMSDSGLVSIQSHTVTHPQLDTLSYDEQQDQLYRSWLAITRYAGKEPIAIAYPEGRRNSDTVALTEEYYRLGIDMNGGLYTTGSDETTIPRYYVSRYTTLSEFAAMVDGN